MKQTMKTKHLFRARLLSLAALCGMVLTMASCASEDTVQNPSNKDNDNDKNLTTFAAGDPSSRTSMTSTGTFYWEAGDKIYVKDDNNVWQASSNSPTTQTPSFKFRVPGQFTAHTSYKVYYPGQGGSNDQVGISAAQAQTKPNTTLHFGISGDCGEADATGGNGVFNFTLNHQAAYLIFQPYTNNTILRDCYLTKIEVNADDNIMGSYTFDPSTGHLTGTGTGKQIVLTTKDPAAGSANEKGFPLTNTAASLATNGAYMVIKPGTHALTIRYWVKDYVTGIEGTITRTVGSRLFDRNKYYNIVSELDVKNYDGHKYYMFDAPKNYWYQHEWDTATPWQPTLNGQTNSNHPTASDPDRWYHSTSTGWGTRADAITPHFKTLPNANEIVWYCYKGDPHWDADELWTIMGHMYKGGMWLLKKDKIASKNSTTTAAMAAAYGSDLRVTASHHVNNTIVQGRPAPSDIGDYFYLPAAGAYTDGTLNEVGSAGHYWSSSGSGWDYNAAYFMDFGSSSIAVHTYYDTNIGYFLYPFQ